MFTEIFDFCLIASYHPVLILIGNFIAVYALEKLKQPFQTKNNIFTTTLCNMRGNNRKVSSYRYRKLFLRLTKGEMMFEENRTKKQLKRE